MLDSEPGHLPLELLDGVPSAHALQQVVTAGLHRQMQELVDLGVMVRSDQGTEDVAQAVGVHHPHADPEITRDLDHHPQQTGQVGPDVEAVAAGVLGCEKYLLAAFPDRLPHRSDDALGRIALQAPPSQPGDAVGAGAQAALGDGDNGGHPPARPGEVQSAPGAEPPSELFLEVVVVQGGDDQGVWESPQDLLAHDRGHAARDHQLLACLAKLPHPLQDLELGGLDDHAGVDDCDVRILAGRDQLKTEGEERLLQRQTLALVHGAAVGLDADAHALSNPLVIYIIVKGTPPLPPWP